MDFSYLSSQLGTNYIPTEEEVLHIKTSKLEAVEKELERIEALFTDLSIQILVLMWFEKCHTDIEHNYPYFK